MRDLPVHSLVVGAVLRNIAFNVADVCPVAQIAVFTVAPLNRSLHLNEKGFASACRFFIVRGSVCIELSVCELPFVATGTVREHFFQAYIINDDGVQTSKTLPVWV
mgnify:CR=1 FL=1